MKKSNNLSEELKNLKQGQKIFIDIDKDLSNSIRLLDTQFISYNNLFTSYINNTSEEANKFNLDKFLDKFYEVNLKTRSLMDQILRIGFGESYKYIKQNGFLYKIDYDIDQIIIMKGEK